MSVTVALLLAGTILTAIGLGITAYFSFRNIRVATAADQRASAEARKHELAEVRAEERRDCEADKQTIRDQMTAENVSLRDQLTEMTRDRDYWRGAYNALLEKRQGGT